MSELEPFQPVEWDESMATGIDAIDKQHRYLVDTLREANIKLLEEDNYALLKQIAKDLLAYAIMHFETEEALMQRHDYASACPQQAREHITQHRHFSTYVVALRDQLREGQEVSRVEVLRFLNHWLREHVLGIDRQLANFLNSKLNNPQNGF
jgi:hemerythrin-like metal-binding protein